MGRSSSDKSSSEDGGVGSRGAPRVGRDGRVRAETPRVVRLGNASSRSSLDASALARRRSAAPRLCPAAKAVADVFVFAFDFDLDPPPKKENIGEKSAPMTPLEVRSSAAEP